MKAKDGSQIRLSLITLAVAAVGGSYSLSCPAAEKREAREAPPVSIAINAAGRPEIWIGTPDVDWDFTAANDPKQCFGWAAIHSGPNKGIWRYRFPFPLAGDNPPAPPNPPNPPNPPDPPQPPPGPVNPYQPSSEWKAACLPVSKIAVGRDDATALAAMYAGVADVIAKADAAIETSADLRAELATRGKPLNIQGKYAGLAEAVEKAFADSLGMEVYKLDKAKATAFLKTLAWAAWEAGKGGK